MRTEFPFRTTARLWREAAGAVAHVGTLTAHPKWLRRILFSAYFTTVKKTGVFSLCVLTWSPPRGVRVLVPS